MSNAQMSGSLFLDVETTGWGKPARITIVGWYFEDAYHRFVNGVDTPDVLQDHWDRSSSLLTFNGRSFDEPFLCRELGFKPHRNHVDLRYVLAQRGLTGGLKAIAASQKISKPAELEGVNGLTAIALWNAFKEGSRPALEGLSFYNAWDVALLVTLWGRFVADPPVEIDVSESIPWAAAASYLRTNWLAHQRAAFWGDVSLADAEAFWQRREAEPLVGLRGANVVFTGRMSNNMTKARATELALAAGAARVGESVSYTTDYLIVGGLGSKQWTLPDEKGEKILTAEGNIKTGVAQTKIVSEADFLKMSSSCWASGPEAAGPLSTGAKSDPKKTRRDKRTCPPTVRFEGGFAAGFRMAVPEVFKAALDIRRTARVKGGVTTYPETEGSPPCYGFSPGDAFYDSPEAYRRPWAEALEYVSLAVTVTGAGKKPGFIQVQFYRRAPEGDRLLVTGEAEITQDEFVEVLRAGSTPEGD